MYDVKMSIENKGIKRRSDNKYVICFIMKESY